MERKIIIKNAQLDPEAILSLSQDLSRDIQSETDIQVSAVEAPPTSGAKGDPVTLGALALTFLSSGAAVALFEVFKAYFQRDSNLEIEVENDEGVKVKLNAKNLDEKSFRWAMGIVESSMAEHP